MEIQTRHEIRLKWYPETNTKPGRYIATWHKDYSGAMVRVNCTDDLNDSTRQAVGAFIVWLEQNSRHSFQAESVTRAYSARSGEFSIHLVAVVI